MRYAPWFFLCCCLFVFFPLCFSIDKEDDKSDRAVALSRELKCKDERDVDDEAERV